MTFGWLRKRRRHKLRARPFPEPWLNILRDNVRAYAELNDAERGKLRGDVQIFVEEKNWEGCGGLAISDEIKVTVAAQACLLVLAFDDQYFDRVQSILVYPTGFVAPDQEITKGGVVLEGRSHRSGEAWYRGPVILSWADVLKGGRRQSEGDNLVLHEFAHQLDMLNGGEADGTPPLASGQQHQRWRLVMDREFRRLEKDCDRGRPTLLDCYGAEDLAEFFAVATECFFERPREMKRRHSALYGVLRDFYRQDPAQRGPEES